MKAYKQTTMGNKRDEKQKSEFDEFYESENDGMNIDNSVN